MEQEHKHLLIGLIGSTFGDLKKLDDSIISQSSTLGRRSEAIKQELAKVVATNVRPQPVIAVPTNPVPQFVPPPQIFNTPAPQVQPQVESQSQPVNDFQLELDFDRKARYVEVVDALHVVENKIDALDKKLDTILEYISSQEKPQKTKHLRKKAQIQVEPTVEEKKKVPGI